MGKRGLEPKFVAVTFQMIGAISLESKAKGISLEMTRIQRNLVGSGNTSALPVIPSL
jgi:hypothetical protein